MNYKDSIIYAIRLFQNFTINTTTKDKKNINFFKNLYIYNYITLTFNFKPI